jgi:hypothetical protein
MRDVRRKGSAMARLKLLAACLGLVLVEPRLAGADPWKDESGNGRGEYRGDQWGDRRGGRQPGPGGPAGRLELGAPVHPAGPHAVTPASPCHMVAWRLDSPRPSPHGIPGRRGSASAG